MMNCHRLLLVLALVVVGCGPGGPPPPVTHPVAGKVTYRDGRSVPGGLIEFRPLNDPTLTTSGVIDSDGTFSLNTLTAREKVPGASEGPHEVTIHPPPGEDQSVQPITLRERYTVQPGDNHFTIAIESFRK